MSTEEHISEESYTTYLLPNIYSVLRSTDWQPNLYYGYPRFLYITNILRDISYEKQFYEFIMTKYFKRRQIR